MERPPRYAVRIPDTPAAREFCAAHGFSVLWTDNDSLVVSVPSRVFWVSGEFRQNLDVSLADGTTISMSVETTPPPESKSDSGSRGDRLNSMAATSHGLAAQGFSSFKDATRAWARQRQKRADERRRAREQESVAKWWFYFVLSLPFGVLLPPLLGVSLYFLVRGLAPVLVPLFRGVGTVGGMLAGGAADLAVSATAAVAREHDRAHGTNVAQRVQQKRAAVTKVASAVGSFTGKAAAVVAAGAVVGDALDGVADAAIASAGPLDPLAALDSTTATAAAAGIGVGSSSDFLGGVYVDETAGLAPFDALGGEHPGMVEVESHVRTAPDGIEENNLSYDGPTPQPVNEDLVEVESHVRTAPDGIKENNLSYDGH